MQKQKRAEILTGYRIFIAENARRMQRELQCAYWVASRKTNVFLDIGITVSFCEIKQVNSTAGALMSISFKGVYVIFDWERP
jgi:hypothetical protein